MWHIKLLTGFRMQYLNENQMFKKWLNFRFSQDCLVEMINRAVPLEDSLYSIDNFLECKHVSISFLSTWHILNLDQNNFTSICMAFILKNPTMTMFEISFLNSLGKIQRNADCINR